MAGLSLSETRATHPLRRGGVCGGPVCPPRTRRTLPPRRAALAGVRNQKVLPGRSGTAPPRRTARAGRARRRRARRAHARRHRRSSARTRRGRARSRPRRPTAPWRGRVRGACSASASAAESEASLISSRSRSSGWAAMIASRRRRSSRRGASETAIACRPWASAARGCDASEASTVATQQLLQRGLALEEHLALVAEVAEERPLGEAGALGDLGRGRALVPALGVELERGFAQPEASVRFPAGHASQSNDSHRHHSR